MWFYDTVIIVIKDDKHICNDSTHDQYASITQIHRKAPGFSYDEYVKCVPFAF